MVLSCEVTLAHEQMLTEMKWWMRATTTTTATKTLWMVRTVVPLPLLMVAMVIDDLYCDAGEKRAVVRKL